MPARAAPIEQDSAEIARLAASENFPVASRLLPRAQRDDLMALYGFARLTDDIGDESEGDRAAELDWLEQELGRAYAGEAVHPVFLRLQPTILRCGLPRQPFLDLIEANRRDQVVLRTATWDDLIGYCRLSANPVGRLVLGVFGLATPERVAWSDDVCTALQLVEHLQDVREDATRGRVYLPADLLAQAACPDADLTAPTASPALRGVVADVAGRTRPLLGSGQPLVRSLHGRPRLAVAGFCAGGWAVLDAVERAGYDVLAVNIRPSRVRMLARWGTVLTDARFPRRTATP
jgi:squalene synthase HpnC